MVIEINYRDDSKKEEEKEKRKQFERERDESNRKGCERRLGELNN